MFAKIAMNIQLERKYNGAFILDVRKLLLLDGTLDIFKQSLFADEYGKIKFVQKRRNLVNGAVTQKINLMCIVNKWKTSFFSSFHQKVPTPNFLVSQDRELEKILNSCLFLLHSNMDSFALSLMLTRTFLFPFLTINAAGALWSLNYPPITFTQWLACLLFSFLKELTWDHIYQFF